MEGAGGCQSGAGGCMGVHGGACGVFKHVRRRSGCVSVAPLLRVDGQSQEGAQQKLCKLYKFCKVCKLYKPF